MTSTSRRRLAALLANGSVDVNERAHINSTEVTPLCLVCAQGDTEIALMLLAAGAAVNQAEGDGSSPLLLACDGGHTETASMLLAAGAAVDQVDNEDRSPLLSACDGDETELVSILLTYGAVVDQLCDDDVGVAGFEPDRTHTDHARLRHCGQITPLTVACRYGYTETVKVLLAAGAVVNRPDSSGMMPLFLACGEGHTETVAALLAAGATVDWNDSNGCTPLFFACYYGHLGTIQLLSSYGACRVTNSDRDTAEEVVAEMAAEVAATEETTAAQQHYNEISDWLITSRQWSTPLHHLDIISTPRARALLRNGADLHAAAAPGGPTPFSLAQAMRAAGDVADGSVAQLVLDAAKPWSGVTHTLFPDAARALAVQLLRLGHLLSRQERFTGEETALFDLWIELVVPRVVQRACVS